ncbi:MAG: hypothetical protein AB1810_05085 [Pseudomonadota bacterium]
MRSLILAGLMCLSVVGAAHAQEAAAADAASEAVAAQESAPAEATSAAPEASSETAPVETAEEGASRAAPASEPAPAEAAAQEPAAPPASASAGAQPIVPAVTAPPPADDLVGQLQALKRDVIELNRDLFILEEELLFPSNTQLTVFVSLDVGNFFALDSVQLQVDGKEVANYLYTEREAKALMRGGVQRLYQGNLKTGEHELVAVFVGMGPNERPYRRAASITVQKSDEPKFIELVITDNVPSQQPDFLVKDWE